MNFRGIWTFSQKLFNMGPWNLVNRHIVGTFRCVGGMGPVEIWFKSSLEHKFCMCVILWAILGLQMNQNSGFAPIYYNYSSGFTSILLYMLIGSTFIDVYNMGLKSPLLSKLSQNPFLWSLSLNFLLVSQQYCFTYALQALLDVWTIWAEVQVCGLLGPKYK